MRSYRRCSASRTASWPLSASSTSRPTRHSSAVSSLRLMRLSSTASTRSRGRMRSPPAGRASAGQQLARPASACAASSTPSRRSIAPRRAAGVADFGSATAKPAASARASSSRSTVLASAIRGTAPLRRASTRGRRRSGSRSRRASPTTTRSQGRSPASNSASMPPRRVSSAVSSTSMPHSASWWRTARRASGWASHSSTWRPRRPEGGSARASSMTGQRMVNQKVEPLPASLSRPMVPPICSTSFLEMTRPRPVPPKRRVAEVSAWVKAVNRRFWSAGLRPMPVSVTLTRRVAIPSGSGASSSMTRMVMEPVSVNFTALLTRLRSTWRMRTGSPTMWRGTSE